MFFVNTCGLSYNQGLYIYLAVLVAVLIWGVYEADRAVQDPKLLGSHRFRISIALSLILMGIPLIGNGIVALALAAGIIAFFYLYKGLRARAVQTVQMSLVAIAMGFSSYGVILVRAVADPPMNENAPADAFSLRYYLAREQYGSAPLFYGPTFASPYKYGADGRPEFDEGEPTYGRVDKAQPSDPDRYVARAPKDEPVYEGSSMMLFPRVYDRGHAQMYNTWMGRAADDMSQPTFGDNLTYFFNYQLTYMYWRYFMWNFAGRQNDLQGDGGLLRGGAATGIPFVDSFFYGDSDTHPEDMTANKGHNVYYALPLILGLIGLFFQIGRGRRGVESFWVTFMLFFMTGIAIVLYLNQYPGQPRERDYAYVGSFYAFAIWVGFGVAAIATTASRYLSKQPAKKTSDEDAPVTISTAAAGVASLVLLLIPIQMAGQNWDDHDRSGRTVASDMGRNYLESCEPNAILFCYGDNDTFPLWYAQEVEGIRTDVRTVNLSYLSGDWYIDQMKKQAYEGKPLPIGLLPKSYYYYNNYALVSPNGGERLSVEEAYKALQGHGPGSPAMLPSPDLYVAVDSAAVAQRIAKSFPALTGHITPDFSLSLHGRQFLDIGGLSVLDLIAGNKWERPIYWAITSPRNAFNGMTASMVQTGMTSQLLPLAPRVDSTGRAIDYGIGNLDRMYETVMTKFRWCGADRPGTYFDENARGIVSTLRNQIFTPLANGYLERGDKQKAQAILKKCLSVILEENVPYETSALYFADALYRADMRAEADHVLQAIARRALSTLTWAVQLPAEKLQEVSRHGELQEAYTAISYALDFAKDYNSQALSRYEQEITALLRRLGVAQ